MTVQPSSRHVAATDPDNRFPRSYPPRLDIVGAADRTSDESNPLDRLASIMFEPMLFELQGRRVLVDDPPL